jgi:hypothetical protein
MRCRSTCWTQTTWACPLGGGHQGRRGQGRAQGRSHRAAIGGLGRLRQRGRQPPGCPHRQGRRILRPRGCLLVEAGVIRPDTILATTVHPLQVVNEPLPETIHDFRVDLIVTSKRPSGAPSRTGHQASSGSIWTRTRSPRCQRWRPKQLGVETPRQSAESSPVFTTLSSHLKAGPAGGRLRRPSSAGSRIRMDSD